MMMYMNIQQKQLIGLSYNLLNPGLSNIYIVYDTRQWNKPDRISRFKQPSTVMSYLNAFYKPKNDLNQLENYHILIQPGQSCSYQTSWIQIKRRDMLEQSERKKPNEARKIQNLHKNYEGICTWIATRSAAEYGIEITFKDTCTVNNQAGVKKPAVPTAAVNCVRRKHETITTAPTLLGWNGKERNINFLSTGITSWLLASTVSAVSINEVSIQKENWGWRNS